MQPGTRRQPTYGILLLAYQVFGVIGVQYIPPVTLSLVAVHTAIFLRLFNKFPPWYKPSDVCVSAYTVWYKGQYKRLLYAAFEHADDMHLYYNMASFILKGRALERRFGGPKFLYLTLMMTVLSNVVLVGLSVFASDYDYDYVSSCAVGFSGLIFALKVLTSYYFPNNTHYMMGIPILIPANYAVWVELLLIQLVSPNVSFLGHLSGILVGLCYVKGPLGPILDGFYSLLKSFGSSSRPQPAQQFAPRSGTSGYRLGSLQMGPNIHSTYMRTDISEDEQVRMATEASLRENFSGSSNMYPDLNTVRNQRLNRFNL